MAVALLVEVRAKGGHDDGEIFGAATRHHCIDGGVFSRDPNFAGWDFTQEEIWGQARFREEGFDAIRRRGDDRETVGPTLCVVLLLEIFFAAVAMAGCSECGR
jgi:hypothetical protein